VNQLAWACNDNTTIKIGFDWLIVYIPVINNETRPSDNVNLSLLVFFTFSLTGDIFAVERIIIKNNSHLVNIF